MAFSRAAAFAAAVALHAGMLAALLATRVRVDAPEAQPGSAITLFLALEPPRPRAESPPADEPGRSRARVTHAAAAARERSTPAAPITIDWTREAIRSAERQVAASAEADRQAAALSSRARAGAIELDTAAPPARKFGWSPMAEGRVQRTEGGGTIVRISERCVLVLSALMPMCALGRLKVNGELFEHLRDPPEMGDWKD